MIAALFVRRAALQDQIATIRRAEKAAAGAPPALLATHLGAAVRAMRDARALARKPGHAIEAAETAVAAIGRLLAAVRALAG